jgi:hypothetical protein
LHSGNLPTKAKVSVLIPFLLSIFAVLIAFASQWICLLNIVVSLANALNCSSALEAKLKATTKALGEADKKCVEEIAATKLAANQAVKKAKARATNAEKGQTKFPRNSRDAKKSPSSILMIY